MTTAVKIHRQDQDKPEGVAVCGRKAAPGRITDDPGAVTCVVCRTFAEEAREAIAPARAPRATALDRLVDTASGDVVDMTRDARAVAKARAMEKLAARHAQEFRALYAEELAATKLLEELDLLDP